jgi:hypothetical protein
MHWILIHNRKNLEGVFTDREEAEDYAVSKYGMNLDQSRRFRTSLVISLPREGVVEIVACECEDYKHEGEI